MFGYQRTLSGTFPYEFYFAFIIIVVSTTFMIAIVEVFCGLHWLHYDKKYLNPNLQIFSDPKGPEFGSEANDYMWMFGRTDAL